MIRTIDAVARPLIAAAFAALFATCHTSCRPPSVPETAYTMQLLGCVEQSKTREESRACRRAVNRAWGLCEHKNVHGVGLCDE
jgi:hypothetical protein